MVNIVIHHYDVQSQVDIFLVYIPLIHRTYLKSH